MSHKLLSRPNSFLAAILSIGSLLSLTGAGSSPVQRNSAPPSILSTVDPVPTYAITWTATGRGFTDVTDTYGIRTVSSRKVTMAGSGIQRNYADGHWDYLPYNLTITDDWDEVVTSPCPYGGTDRDHTTWTITDPGRYTGGPNTGISIFAPDQHLDGTWYMLDPFSGFNPGFFNYRNHSEAIWCNGQTASGTSIDPQFTYDVLIFPGELEGDAQGKVFTKNTQFVGIGYPPLTVQWDVTVRVLDGRDLTVDRLEVTQALQDGANTLPLIQGRRTVVRAYLGIGQDPVPVPFVTGKLSGYVGSTLLGSVPAFNPGGRIVAPVDPDWQQIDHTLNFELPYAWTLQPTLRLEVEVNPDHSVAELNYNNNKRSTLMIFLPCGGVSVTYSPIHYTPPGGYSPADPSANINVGAEFMCKIYPIPDKGLAYFPHEKMALTDSINMTGTDRLVLAGLSAELLSSSAPRAEHIYAWLPSLAYNDNGKGYMPGEAAFGNDTESPNRWRRTFAHEIGHNYGLDHSDLTTGGRHWFDVYDRVIKPVPASVGGKDLLDVMVPERLESEGWISPVNYEYLVGQICSGGAAAAEATTQSPAAADTLLVTGIVSNTTPAAGSLEPLYRFTTVPTYTLPVGSEYCVNLRDAANTQLGQYCFNQDFAVDSGTPAGAMPFGMVVPYPPLLNRVELVQGATVLASRVKSTNSPTVTVTSPNAAGLTLSGNQNITWTGSDLDGNPLTYNILYSRDNGATWVGIGSGITGTTYNLDFSGLAGTIGAGGKIKVMVSDGFNSAEDISDNPFTIGNKPPVAAIISPPPGAAFTTGPKVVLEGAGMDLENGSLGDSALSWLSSIDGALGAGQLVEVSLSPGVHTITLTATDSDGVSGVASIQITVVQATTIKHVFLPLIKK
jgi:Metallo-peptidase family M12B Reprolysin-like